MSFLEAIKFQMKPENQHGHRTNVMINRKRLVELIHHFERLDAEARKRYEEEQAEEEFPVICECGSKITVRSVSIAMPKCCLDKMMKENKELKEENEKLRKAMERMGGGSVKRGPDFVTNK